ncbi:hypothetical protein COEREDRAFT_10416 [Coemansia reversa NRRL 1564]|uniref:Uncharacterized protein n=1 Tax=Coemansia reversa (strain ATCC 12441 / NRRL 1564) TaxID=763665 RepID=A0A2G5B5Q3_COERN|nr:hypothetical protein COEREDRAFT_10416 [Coemansia reversa NRRL 1564]|eukprot:PIA14373.1 hypothetical protein COEREDRAFT_10416 [Coemansia reversa NRRL 1564]
MFIFRVFSKVSTATAATTTRRCVSSTGAQMHVHQHINSASDAEESTVRPDIIDNLASGNEDIEMTRHYEKTMAQEAINAVASGDIRVMPSAPDKYHRIRELHSD